MLKKLGPGLLYAAAAIGVSHLIQSTRAGATFGHQLIWVVLAANFFKYPFFKAAPLFTAKTGKNLIQGYYEIGHWVIWPVTILTLLTMFIIQAAVTIVTAGIANSILGIEINPAMTSMFLLVICFLLLYFGKYQLLDNFVKYIVAILTLTTLATVIFASTSNFDKVGQDLIFEFSKTEHLFFFIALVGWMPAPMDIPIWHSLWVQERNENPEKSLNFKETIFDFNVGFIGTALVAVLFVLLGSIVMYKSGSSFSPKAAIFAGQLMDMYTKALGSWSYPLIAIAAFTTMFSTTLTCLDGSPRVMKACMENLFPSQSKGKPLYGIFLLFLIAGTGVILFAFIKNMRQMVDFATTLSFFIAPIYGVFNYILLNKLSNDGLHPFQWWEKMLSILGIIFLSMITIYYLAVRY